MTKTAAKHLPIRSSATQDRLKGKLAARENSDLVFALTGYIGSGESHVARVLSEQAQSLGFQPSSIRLSDLLAKSGAITRSHIAAVGETERLQDEGDRLRQAHGSSIVAGLGVREMHRIRATESIPNRIFILDSLKHPAEVDVLRAIYGSSFYLIGVICNEQTRRQRLELKFKNPADRQAIEGLMDRDRAGAAKYGQQVHKTLHLADFFVANEDREAYQLPEQLDRFLLAVTGRTVVRPTPDERGMHAAWTASLRSSCLSRQVGAALVGPHGDLLATGTNDPPSPGGGVYQEGSNPDHRCFKWGGDGGPGCRNDRKKQEIYAEIYKKMNDMELLRDAVDVDRLADALMQTRIRDLIEFSRAVHAEMDALLELARKGGGIPENTSLFCRTYPCHSCARHIVAAGIGEVVYIEPYDKSLALELHADALREVTVRLGDEPGDKRVVFRLFSGVAPRRFAALFEKRRDLKDERGAVLPIDQSPTHADPVLTGSFLELEKELAEDVSTALEEVGGAD